MRSINLSGRNRSSASNRRLTWSWFAGWLPYIVVGLVLLGSVLAGLRASRTLLVLIVAIGAGVVLVRKPVLGLVFLPVLAILPMDFSVSTSVNINPAVLAIPVFAVLWLVNMLLQRRVELAPSRVNLPMIVFLLAAAFSLVIGNVYWNPFVPRPGNILFVQIGQWAIYGLSIVAFLVTAGLVTSVKWLKAITYAFLLVHGGLALLYVIPPLKPFLDSLVPLGATTSITWLLVTSLSLGLLLFYNELSPVAKVLCFLIVAAQWYLALRQVSWVSGYLPMAVTTVTLVGLKLGKKSIIFYMLLAGLLAIAFPSIVGELGLQQEISTSGEGRLGHYTIVLILASQHPWFGLGMAAYRHYSWAYPALVQANLYRGVGVSSHNNYIDIYAQMGVFGLLVFLWLLVILGRELWRIRSYYAKGFESAYTNAMVAAGVGTLASGLLGDWFLPFAYNIGFKGFRASVMVWMLLGGVVALDRMRSSADQS